ncbi:MAG: EamA family transporter [Alphaproteobacteria bacterium]|nr:EamA family transporter [Alphaproteobacteria bacterium]
MALQFDLALLVLASAFAHAAWNALLKSSGDQLMTFTALRGVAFVAGVAAALFLPFPAADSWPYLIASAIIHNAYHLLLLYAYRHGDLSLVYPIARGGAPFLIAILAALFAGEVPSPGGAAGIALVSVGIVALAFAHGIPKGANATAVLLAAGTAAATASYTLADGLGTRLSGNAFGYSAWLFICDGLPFLLYMGIRRGADAIEHFRRDWRRGLGGGLLMMGTYTLILYVFTRGPMATVSALRETSVLFAAIIGAVMLKESLGPRRIVAAAVIVAGVVLLQLSR